MAQSIVNGRLSGRVVLRVVALFVIALLVVSVPVLAQESGETVKPNIVLVHGA
ncbi:MAG: hypothetical protein U0670_14205 [Anaerolineae bacterium]